LLTFFWGDFWIFFSFISGIYGKINFILFFQKSAEIIPGI